MYLDIQQIACDYKNLPAVANPLFVIFTDRIKPKLSKHSFTHATNLPPKNTPIFHILVGPSLPERY